MIGWKVKLTIWLNDHVLWLQPNKVNMNEVDCGGWNEWGGLWTEGNKNETWTMKCWLKEMRWNTNNEVWTDGTEMKHEQWRYHWRGFFKNYITRPETLGPAIPALQALHYSLNKQFITCMQNIHWKPVHITEN